MSLIQEKNEDISTIIISLRPRHWVKNIFVFAPLIFSGRFNQISACFRAVVAFICFCLVSSAVYLINDLFDRRQDRLHPLKKNRPIASGKISTAKALSVSFILVAAAFIAAGLLEHSLAVILVIYLLVNIGYSVVLKHIVIIDVLTISAGFVLRVAGGGVVVSVVPSYWLILCTVMISLFLGFAKRRAELIIQNNEYSNFRPVLKDYSKAYLDQVIPVITASTIISYALYTVDEHTVSVLGSRAMLFTFPCVIFGMLRYIYIIYHFNRSQDPTEFILSDKPAIINLAVWIILSLFVVGYGSGFKLPW